jgi:uncharacterized protein (TIGR02996 family)
VRQDGPVRTTEVDFLAEILAAPDEDGPRLVLADWFEDHDDERGEFIRLQCERAHLPQHDDRWWQLWDREQELLARHGDSWLRRWPRPRFLGRSIDDYGIGAPFAPGTCIFRRGLPEAASARNVSALRRGLEAPERRLVREIHLLSYDPRLLPGLLGVLAGHSGLAVPTSQLGAEFVAPLAQCPAAADLRRLDLRGNLLQRTSLEWLCSSPYLRSLQSLNLSWNRLASRDFLVLRQWPGLGNLRELWLAGNAMDRAGSELLADPALAGLHLLDVGDCSGEAPLVEMLLENASMQQLTHLSLAGANFDRATFRRLLAEERLSTLRVLDLSRCPLTDNDLEQMTHAPMMRRVRNLALGFDVRGLTTFTRAGLRALAEASCLRELRRLTLSCVEMDRETARMLAESESLPLLSRLKLVNCEIAREAYEHLSRFFPPGRSL